MIDEHPVTVLDEPIVYRGVEEFFVGNDPDLEMQSESQMMWLSTPAEHDPTRLFERFMMNAFVEIFTMRPLAQWFHTPPISEMCRGHIGKAHIAGWNDSERVEGATYLDMSIEEFLDGHVFHQSVRHDRPVPPFFFPKYAESEPDMVFVIRIEGSARSMTVPVYVQMKMHQGASVFAESVSDTAPGCSPHVPIVSEEDLRRYCPDNVYISIMVTHPMEWTRLMPSRPLFQMKGAEDVQRVAIQVDDDNFDEIFPKECVEFIQKIQRMTRRWLVDGKHCRSPVELCRQGHSLPRHDDVERINQLATDMFSVCEAVNVNEAQDMHTDDEKGTLDGNGLNLLPRSKPKVLRLKKE
ncbi:hypothetical protein DFQ27_002036 [Actinomortierella ambigua]|uniref:Uncharacterized protein n=1 Tax=Actinomortierella ambigua TaxID=1343610 RepID=A0A9P6Q8F2_9FUNG|nr:hypothetical protein DFQ27_002036 [Actinomortierella ambigua]